MPHDRIARVVIGLSLALGFAVLAAHPRVKALEKRLGVTVLVSAGLPFLGMGAIFSLDSIGILTPRILEDLRPAFEFGLGWIGFVVGMQFDVRKLDKIPASLAPVIVIETVVPALATGLLCSIALIGLGVPWTNAEFARDALILAGCAAPSAPVAYAFLAQRVGHKPARLVAHVTGIDEVAALGVLGLAAIFFRPQGDVLWTLPSSAWLLVEIGLGGVLGVVTYVLIRGASTSTEKLALLLGAISLSAGMAGYLALSVPVVCAVAGALLANLPMSDAEGFKRTLLDVERPLYLIFLVVVGASWRPSEWQGWILAPTFVFARVIGKRLGAIWSKRLGPPDLPSARELSLALVPQSPIAIVAVVSASTLFHNSNIERIHWATNAVIIGGVLTELVVRALERVGPRGRPSPPTEAVAAASDEIEVEIDVHVELEDASAPPIGEALS
jgi:hypothetical protein